MAGEHFALKVILAGEGFALEPNNLPRRGAAGRNAPMRPSARSALLLSTDIVSLAGHVR
jgi:hypothetical protein